MRIVDVEVIPYQIPNRELHHIATLTLSALDNVIVRIRTDEGIDGVGEAVSEPKWNSTVREAHADVLRHYLAPVLIGMNPFDIAVIWQKMNQIVNGHYSAKAGIDLALYDVVGKALRLPLWRLLGGALRTRIDVEGPGFGIGFMEPRAAAEFALQAVRKGCRQIEVKCGHPSGWRRDVTAVRAVREACGPGISLKLDLTEAYTFKSAMEALPQFKELGVDWVEQPLPRHQLADLARLRNSAPVGIMLEESVGHAADVLRIAELGAADAVHVKVPMLGGITMSRQIMVVCEAAGLGVQSGSSTPSGIGLSAVHQLAAVVPNLVRGCHGSPLARAVDDVVIEPVDAYAATIELTETPGLGIEVDWAKVEKYRVH
ncbi:MAG TPA: enolase C-terminal domain-like protein [bacterium]|nr:enolase C-terminal domain-like protein [bacterium]